MNDSETAPVLEAHDLRVQRHGRTVARKIDTAVSGNRVVVAGPGAEALQAVLMHEADVEAGSLQLAGVPWERAIETARCGLAPATIPALARTTVEQYLTLSYRLDDLGKREASQRAQQVLSMLGLVGIRSILLERLQDYQQRAVSVAAALRPGVRCVWVEYPLEGLNLEQGQTMLGLLAQVSSRADVIASVREIDLSPTCWPLIQGANRLLWLGTDGSQWSGVPADLLGNTQGAWLEIHGDDQAAVEALSEAGVSLRGQAPRFVARLPRAMGFSQLTTLVARAGGIVVELLPLPAFPQATTKGPDEPEEATRERDGQRASPSDSSNAEGLDEEQRSQPPRPSDVVPPGGDG